MVSGAVANAIEQEMATRGVPGVSTAIVEEGSIEWTGGFGVRRPGGEPVTADTVFEAASLSKPVFTWCILGLCDRGILDLDRPLTDYTTDRFLPDEDLAVITARMILTHTSGLTWEITGSGYEGRPRLDENLGREFRYSGVGFDYL